MGSGAWVGSGAAKDSNEALSIPPRVEKGVLPRIAGRKDARRAARCELERALAARRAGSALSVQRSLVRGLRHSPERPPRFSSSRTCSISISWLRALLMS